jgi:hypothetical protein
MTGPSLNFTEPRRRCTVQATSRSTMLIAHTQTGWKQHAGWSDSAICTAARSCCLFECDSSKNS